MDVSDIHSFNGYPTGAVFPGILACQACTDLRSSGTRSGVGRSFQSSSLEKSSERLPSNQNVFAFHILAIKKVNDLAFLNALRGIQRVDPLQKLCSMSSFLVQISERLLTKEDPHKDLTYTRKHS